MPLPVTTARALREAGVDFVEDEPLARRTWWRVGGPADAFATARTLDQLVAVQRAARREGVPVFPLGNASNLLVSDAGIRGVVVALAGTLSRIDVLHAGPPARLRVGGGAKLMVLVKRAEENGWSGLEVFAGIPGTVGGAVRMNAGASLGDTSDVLVSVEIVDVEGNVAEVGVDALHMAYRTAHLPEGAIVATAVLQCSGADPEPTFARMRDFLERRKLTQPVSQPSCGSTFRNPPGDFAGRLVEAAGLKGHRIGDAQISEKHANFVVNLGSATAADIRRVIEHARGTVLERFGIALVPEVHLAGDWSDWQ